MAEHVVDVVVRLATTGRVIRDVPSCGLDIGLDPVMPESVSIAGLDPVMPELMTCGSR